MTEPPHVDLPTREDLKRAIKPWWSGGGTAEMIVDVLRNHGADLDEAERLASRMTEVAEWKRFISKENIEEQLELSRAAQAYRAHGVGSAKDNDSNERVIGSRAWFERANRKAQESWNRFFPGEKAPRANPGEHYSDEADERYRALIRSQREAIRGNVGKKQRKRWET